MRFDNSYALLPETFYQRINPVPVKKPQLVRVNGDLARELGLDLPDDDEALANIFSGNIVPEGAEPIAQAYAGHQFGHFVPQLGDGRAVLLGEVLAPSGKRYDIQLKGAGQTRFSRAGDGRSPLGPVIREYIVSEAMAALGIPSSRALAMVTTGESVYREEVLPGGVLTRVAASHIRVGTFEYFAARGDYDSVRLLADHVIDRHYPEARGTENPYADVFARIVRALANLVARWMGVGFIHGVMNTDNTAVSGETIDFGPCAFLDVYNPQMVFSSIDAQGRYAYDNQPTIAQWNASSLGGCLFPLMDTDQEKAQALAEEILASFPALFKERYQSVMCHKLGFQAGSQGRYEVVRGLLKLMHENRVDYTLAFRLLAVDEGRFVDLFEQRDDVRDWLSLWRRQMDADGIRQEEAQQRMVEVNPAFIPRNHRVEAAIRAAEDHNDFSLTHRLIDILKSPYKEQPENVDYMAPPEPQEVVKQTFCGT